MKRWVLVSLACTTLGVSSVHASENQLWTSVAMNGPARDGTKLLLWFDGHARSRNDVDDLGVTIFRPGVGWRATARVDLWTGYANVVARRDGLPGVREQRFWQQATYAIAAVGSGKVNGRTRLEQRFRATGGGTGWRVRHTVGYSRPLAGSPSFSLVLSNETFIGLNGTDWGQRGGYDQNRAFIGLSFKRAPGLSTSIGYLNNHLDLGSAGRQTNHTVSAGVFVGL